MAPVSTLNVFVEWPSHKGPFCFHLFFVTRSANGSSRSILELLMPHKTSTNRATLPTALAIPGHRTPRAFYLRHHGARGMFFFLSPSCTAVSPMKGNTLARGRYLRSPPVATPCGGGRIQVVRATHFQSVADSPLFALISGTAGCLP